MQDKYTDLPNIPVLSKLPGNEPGNKVRQRASKDFSNKNTPFIFIPCIFFHFFVAFVAVYSTILIYIYKKPYK